jgi:hypothetical protein
MVAKMTAMRQQGDGCGLSGGILVDMFITNYLSSKMDNFTINHRGESDCKIGDHPLSIKKITGKSTIALDWSKNGAQSKPRDRWNTDMMIINLRTETWRKHTPPLPAGIYFVSRIYCKEHITLSSNNKTNSLIKSDSLYTILQESIMQERVILFPTDIPVVTFDILRAFC